MLDAVLEDACLELLSCTEIFFTYILLGAEDNGFGAEFTINLINGLVETLHLLMSLCVVVDEVRLHAIVRTDSHDDDSGTFVVVALAEDPRGTPVGCLHYLLGGICRSQEPFLGHVPVLGQVFTEMVGVDEHADGLGLEFSRSIEHRYLY